MLLASILATSAFAQRGEIEIGSAAPGLSIDKWVTGSETSVEAGRVYVIAFLATRAVQRVMTRRAAIAE